MSVQDIILKLQEFWAHNGCYIASGYDNEVGAGTMTPDTFFRVLGKKSWKVAYWQPSRRPDDGRYAQNPNRVQKHNQFQVILKPAPVDGQALFAEAVNKAGRRGKIMRELRLTGEVGPRDGDGLEQIRALRIGLLHAVESRIGALEQNLLQAELPSLGRP